MKRDFNAPIGDHETGPSTKREIEYWVIDYRSAIYERAYGFPVNDEGYFITHKLDIVGDHVEYRYVAYPLLFGLLPKWSNRREVHAPSDVQRMKDKLPWYYGVKLESYSFFPRS